jgi:uncharacterized protein YaaR (DUF327 family)
MTNKAYPILSMKFILSALMMLTCSFAICQNGNWDVYMGQWDKGTGSVILNLDLIDSAPNLYLPFIVITGVKFKNCTRDGFPEDRAYKNLYQISDSVHHAISQLTASEPAGTFTYQCERLDYIYVKDSIDIRDRLHKMYANTFGKYEHSVTIKEDPEWKTYRTFLFPNEETQETMSNQKVIDNLQENGDDLSQPRKVDHWIYFKSPKDLETFVHEIRNENFKIESSDLISANEFPFQLHLSRTDYVDLVSINKITMFLRKTAALHGGDYDGWETSIIKK